MKKWILALTALGKSVYFSRQLADQLEKRPTADKRNSSMEDIAHSYLKRHADGLSLDNGVAVMDGEKVPDFDPKPLAGPVAVKAAIAKHPTIGGNYGYMAGDHLAGDVVVERIGETNYLHCIESIDKTFDKDGQVLITTEGRRIERSRAKEMRALRKGQGRHAAAKGTTPIPGDIVVFEEKMVWTSRVVKSIEGSAVNVFDKEPRTLTLGDFNGTKAYVIRRDLGIAAPPIGQMPNE